MNVGNANKEPATTNLELSLGYSNHCVSSRSSDQGAGVNAAASRVDMTYVASDPLSELVWSPNNGLSLKGADCSFITKPSPLIWDVGPSKFSDKGKLVTSQASLVITPGNIVILPLVKPNFGLAGGDMDEVNSAGETLVALANLKEGTSKNYEEGRHIDIDKGTKEHKAVYFHSRETNERVFNEKDSSMPIRMQCSSPERRKNDFTFDIKNENETRIKCSTILLPLERLECTAENELPLDKSACRKSEDRLPSDKSAQLEAPPAFHKTLLDRERGKEKVLYEGSTSKTTSKNKDDSDESVESCSSVGLFPAGKKRGRVEQELILGSKRVKNLIQENTISPMPLGQPSSFMNWISNMVKGLNRIDEEEEPSLALTLANPKEVHEGEGGDNKIVPCNVDMGFRTIFRSIYCQEPNKIGIKTRNEKPLIKESKELVWTEGGPGSNATPVSCHRGLACVDMADGRNSSSSETRAEYNKCDNPKNLWITRFSSKSHEHLVGMDRPSLKMDHKCSEISNYSLPSRNVKNKGVMTSEFAQRIDALRHITPSEVMEDKAQEMLTCLYCGEIGHDLSTCSEIVETDRDNFVRNMSVYEGMEESRSRLCIRCFQVGHWASSCPKRLMLKIHSQSKLGDNKAVNFTFGHEVAKGEKLASLCSNMDRKLQEVPKGIFDAIRKLRLTRLDIYKWMNTPSSLLSLDGYFLRLRLGKWEKSQGGTGYYVACITSERKGKQPQGSKRPICVDIEGKSCVVESRFISNQDFFEEELTAWWSTTVKSGGSIPSVDDLKVKFEERRRLRL